MTDRLALWVGKTAAGNLEEFEVADEFKDVVCRRLGGIILYFGVFFVVGVPLDFILPDNVDLFITTAYVILGWLLARRIPSAYGPPSRRGVGIVLMGVGVVVISLGFLGPPLLLKVVGAIVLAIGLRLVQNSLDEWPQERDESVPAASSR